MRSGGTTGAQKSEASGNHPDRLVGSVENPRPVWTGYIVMVIFF